jgi:hypothetical protein
MTESYRRPGCKQDQRSAPMVRMISKPVSYSGLDRRCLKQIAGDSENLFLYATCALFSESPSDPSPLLLGVGLAEQPNRSAHRRVLILVQLLVPEVTYTVTSPYPIISSRPFSAGFHVHLIRAFVLLSVFSLEPLVAQQSCSQCNSAYSSCNQQVSDAYNACSGNASQSLSSCQQMAQSALQSCVARCANGSNGSMCGVACDDTYGGDLQSCQAQYDAAMIPCNQTASAGQTACGAALNSCTNGPPACTN